MREIKFRAYVQPKKWNDLELPKLDKKIVYITYLDLYGKTCGNNYIDEYDLSEVKLMQSTGLLDKYDELIYEGDIVAISLYTNKGEFELENGIIKWSEKSSAFKWYSLQDDPSDDNNYWLTNQDESYRQIIGNIYENKDLL